MVINEVATPLIAEPVRLKKSSLACSPREIWKSRSIRPRSLSSIYYMGACGHIVVTILLSIRVLSIPAVLPALAFRACEASGLRIEGLG